jgi:predicted NBD/HSP70 family sugar kinase
MYTIGIDLGGTNIAVGVVKDGKDILCKIFMLTE